MGAKIKLSFSQILELVRNLPGEHMVFVELTEEFETLAQKYINSQIVLLKVLPKQD